MSDTSFSIVINDSKGYQYNIPLNMTHKFILLKEDIIETMVGSDHWYEAMDSFDAEFDKYVVNNS